MTFQLFNSNPTILIKGYLQQEYESWGLRNITVDKGFCQKIFLICSDFSSCTQCDTTYKLYQNKCVQNCPIHSSNCIDYKEIIPSKGFYDLNMTLDEIQQFYDQTTDPSFSLSTKQKFSFFNNKIVLGGLLVWNDGSYIKTWIIQKPHYAATIYFNLTYGDTYTGSFYYKIGSTSSIGFQGPFNNPGGGLNLIGRTGLESIRFFNVSLTNFYTNNLYIEFKCDVSITNITKEFCAISEYFIVIHYCPPFCSSCTSLNTCSDVGYTGPNCGSNQYLDFDSSTENYSCKNCNQPGCNTCTSIEECTQCVNNQFILINGICLCNPLTFLQGNNCVQCNKCCENCYGDSQYNCLTCVKDHHREINVYVQLDIMMMEIIYHVFLFVEIKQQQVKKNVMMVILKMMMAVLIVKQNVKSNIHYVNKIFAKNVMLKIGNQVIKNAYQYAEINQSWVQRNVMMGT
ncbi:unnamed protein product [Paramecium pentaurelia]|uniref:TNFR-Cys domain-containing protein n=1 Tax=Paramecium pentaurelia TaxID=43138 RepID=A0A8S1YA77_9CILI|nr:unnamed protein product [Paramecium pentaurelia]